jgi:hypothetical protein
MSIQGGNKTTCLNPSAYQKTSCPMKGTQARLEQAPTRQWTQACGLGLPQAAALVYEHNYEGSIAIQICYSSSEAYPAGHAHAAESPA